MAVVNRRSHSVEFKLQVLRELEAGKSAAQVCREHRIDPSLIKRWKKQREELAEAAASGVQSLREQSERIADLERLVGQLSVENLVLKKALTRLEATAKPPIVTGKP